MARKSVINRNLKRQKESEKNKNKRLNLKRLIRDKNIDIAQRFEHVLELNKMSRDSSLIRVRNRCAITGRPRGCYRKLGISRIELRRMVGFGLVPGIRKSSW